MSTYSLAKLDVVQALKAALDKRYTPSADEIVATPNAEFGDLAFPCFGLAKGEKRPPHELASELAAKIGPRGMIRKIQAVGPYVNFTLDSTGFGKRVLQEVLTDGAQFGEHEATGKTVMIEYAQPNTHKEVHVGHIRNFVVGQSLINLTRAAGATVIAVSYINDLGNHVAKCLWGFKRFFENEKPGKEDRTAVLGRAYVQATAAAEMDASVREEIAKVYQDLENGTGPYLPLWRKTKSWSMQEIKSVFKELGLPVDVWYFESGLLEKTREIIEDLKARGVVVYSEGAWIVPLQEEKLGVNLLVKSDGTLLYNAKDLALAWRKEHEYHPDRSLYVVDARQSLAMQQLFSTAKKMGLETDFAHVRYEFVTLKDGAMSSRKGNIIRYQSFRDELLSLARKETEVRHPDWSTRKREAAVRAVAFAAIRFGMLKQDLDKLIVFDPKEAMAFDGCTGPYLLYAVARAHAVLRKAGKSRANGEWAFAHPSEHHLLLLLGQYPDRVFQAAQTAGIASFALYLYDVAKAFTEFYAAAPILQAETPALRASRLSLTRGAVQVLENGLGLLGIETVKEM